MVSKTTPTPIKGENDLGRGLLEWNLFKYKMGEKGIDAILIVQQLVAIVFLVKNHSIELERHGSHMAKEILFFCKGGAASFELCNT